MLLSKDKADNTKSPLNLLVETEFHDALKSLSKRDNKTMKSIIVEGVYLYANKHTNGEKHINGEYNGKSEGNKSND